MKLFKSIDEKFNELGLVKIEENEYGARYERTVPKFGYTQCLDLTHKASGRHLIQSYQKEINTDNFNNNVGLSMYEAKLAYKKMKQMGWNKIIK